MNEPTPIARNEPCPCGSGAKYKRCCGKGAAPVLTIPKSTPSVDPTTLAGVSSALKSLPKSQMKELQKLMKRGMAGEDISKEAQALEGQLPPEFLAMLGSLPEMNKASPKKESFWKRLWSKKTP